MPHELVTFVESLDRCWQERRFDDLSAYLANDIVIVVPGGGPRVEGLMPAIDSYREFMRRSEVQRFDTSDHMVTERGDTAVVEYDWDMDWTSDGASYEAAGRELLVLARRDGGWRVVWRTHIPA